MLLKCKRPSNNRKRVNVNHFFRRCKISLLRTLQEVRDKLINFGKLISGCSYEERLGIVQSTVDRVIVRAENGMQVVHVFVKGNLNDTYEDFYEEGNGCTKGDQETSEDTESDVVASALSTGEGKMYNQEQYRQCI